MKIYVPRDAAAKALGAEDVVRALMAEAGARGLTVEIVRTGTRGMIWLEPLVEVERDGVRHGYGPFAPSDAVASSTGLWTGSVRWRRSRSSRGRTA
jgi:formate dehydrogenase iron-sulfur subunit